MLTRFLAFAALGLVTTCASHAHDVAVQARAEYAYEHDGLDLGLPAPLASVVPYAGLPAAVFAQNAVRAPLRPLAIRVTSSACVPARITIAAGRQEFDLAGAAGSGTTAYVVARNDDVVGEVEVAPGRPAAFALDLRAGTYELGCAGAAGPDRRLVAVTDAAPLADASLVAQESAAGSVAAYHRYLLVQEASLVGGVSRLERAIASGDRVGAEHAYVGARAPLVSIAPLAARAGRLAQLDAPATTTPAAFASFHTVERMLWSGSAMPSIVPVARALVADVETLRERTRAAAPAPARIARFGADMLASAASVLRTGDAEPYARTDLADVRASVDGARAAFDAIAPMLEARQAARVSRVRARFESLDATFATFGGDLNYVRYDGLDRRDVAPFARSVEALRTSLAALARVVARPAAASDVADANAVATDPPAAREALAPDAASPELTTLTAGRANDRDDRDAGSAAAAAAPAADERPPGDPTVFDTPVPDDGPLGDVSLR